MKTAYPVTMLHDKKTGEYVVYVPDMTINTQGKDLPDAIEMARDAISVIGVYLQDEGKPIPMPSDIEDIVPEEGYTIKTLVDVDFDDYRRKNDLRTVKKNCTLPSWVSSAAEQAGVNFSQVLQAALIEQLGLVRPRARAK
jgi:predicted RNase H-like HicB family nuclease